MTDTSVANQQATPAAVPPSRRFADEHLAHWRKHGYVIVPNFLSADELASARENFYRYFPTWEEYDATPQRWKQVVAQRWQEFPFEGDALNDLSTSRELLYVAELLLGTPDIAMTQSLIWAKYPDSPGLEQSLHVDYQNNSLLYPSDVPGFQQIPIIVYLSDVTKDNGATRILSRQHSRGEALGQSLRTREERPEWYEHEVAAAAPAGSVLIHTMGTFHRGSSFTARAGARATLHLVYRPAACQWMGWRSWPHHGMSAEMKRFMEHATPRQREMIGVPPPRHPYWTKETLAGMVARYPAFDVAPYQS